jgi:hypothetical protein
MSPSLRRKARAAAGAPSPVPPPVAPALPGSMVARIDELAARVHVQPDAALERELARLRHLAFPEARAAARDVPEWPPRHPDLFPGADGPPAVGPDRFSAAVLGSAIVHHGALIVRGLLSDDQARRARHAVETAYAARAALEEPDTTGAPPWYEPFVPEPGYKNLAFARPWVREGSGLWTADSPRAMARVAEILEEVGVRPVVTEHLGTRPVIALKKWTLRKVLPQEADADWHQDGAFLGTGIRVLNLWLALSDCGVHAPGLDVVPRRLDGVLPTGTHEANFDWSVGPGLVAEVAVDAPVQRLEFRAGDAMLFDELLLHRTAFAPGMTQHRFAIETWFFAPGDYPAGDVPLVF